MDTTKEKITLGEYLKACRDLGEDRDICVDGIEGSMIVYCGERLTKEGKRHFKDALNLPMWGCCVTSNDDHDYEEDEDGYLVEDSKLRLAWELLSGMAGYCSCEDYDKYFIMD